MSLSRIAFARWMIVVKIILMVAALYLIYRQVLAREHFTNVVKDIRLLSKNTHAITLLITCIVLLMINWGLEALKWKFLITKISPITFFQSLNAILSGVTVSFFTPNRVGEFAGRVMHLPEGVRIKATLATFIGNTSQLLITMIFGLYALGFLIMFFEIESWLRTLLQFLILGISIASVIFYFKISILNKWLLKIKFLKRFAAAVHAFSEYSKMELLRILLLAVLRYIIYTTQYILMLQLMNVGGDWSDLFLAIAIVFLVITIVPTIAISELAVRGSVAVSVISLLSENKLGILEASFLLWFINLVIPAVIGSFTLLTLKLSRSK